MVMNILERQQDREMHYKHRRASSNIGCLLTLLVDFSLNFKELAKVEDGVITTVRKEAFQVNSEKLLFQVVGSLIGTGFRVKMVRVVS